ncbi:FecR family protein [Hymenobacter bucti]|uniref:FecR family protein n=1 Tax=Hymenobacter bucti TaxID=1844114 RepID=A0ABW4QPF7_9BACT
MSQDAQHLIEKFWDGTATAADKQQLAALFGPDEDTWHERLGQEFAAYPAGEAGPLKEEQSARVWAQLRRHLAAEAAAAPTPRRAGWQRWAVAAAVLLAVGLAVLRFAYRPAAPAPIAQVTRPAAPTSPLVRRANTGRAPLRLPLPDGSVVTLQPGSEVAYYAPFVHNRRDISLRGAALFAVAKDAAHPFTVLANGFTTTALGTKFRVQATDSQRVNVRLLEGKVVVRATPASHLTMREQFLKPGQELTVNVRTRQVRLHTFGPLPAAPRPLAVEVPTGLSFEKDDLTEVLAQVGARYHVRMAYDSADVRGLSFSGDFEAADPLPVVLRAVCAANNLTFTQTPGLVTLRKSP